MHNLHHARQKDYIAVHPLLTLSLYASLWAAFGFGSSAVMIGFSLGYDWAQWFQKRTDLMTPLKLLVVEDNLASLELMTEVSPV